MKETQFLLKQKISPHPDLVGVQREIIIYGVDINTRFQIIMIDAEFRYSNVQGEDISDLFNTDVHWEVNNTMQTTVRDARGNPVPNSNYIEWEPTDEEQNDPRADEEKERYQRAPAFDYFLNIIKNPEASNLINLLKAYVSINDSDGFFN